MVEVPDLDVGVPRSCLHCEAHWVALGQTLSLSLTYVTPLLWWYKEREER